MAHDFCVTMKNLLVYLLLAKNYKYQIYYRIKSIDSLTKKIVKKTAEGTKVEKLGEIEDLAGIRIVFYLESDKKRFVSDFIQRIYASEIEFGRTS